MLAQAKTEVEIANALGVDQTTISLNVKALKEAVQEFIYDLAKPDLAFYYKQCLDRVDEIIRLAFNRFNDDNVPEKVNQPC